jgi:hypothetical protein
VPAEQVASVVSAVDTAQNSDINSQVTVAESSSNPGTNTNLEDVTEIVGATLDSKPTVSILTDIETDNADNDDDNDDQGGGKKVIINI